MKERKLNKTWLIVGAIILAVIVLYFIYRTYKPEIDLLLDFNAHNKAKLLHMIRSHGFTDIFLLVRAPSECWCFILNWKIPVLISTGRRDCSIMTPLHNIQVSCTI